MSAGAPIGISARTDVAIEASDLTLVRGDLLAADDAIRLSRKTLGTIKTNLFWAFAYNVAAIPLAATGFLNPVVAGAAMAFSSVFVVSNSLRLRRFGAAWSPEEHRMTTTSSPVTRTRHPRKTRSTAIAETIAAHRRATRAARQAIVRRAARRRDARLAV